MEFAIVIGIVITILGLLAYEDYTWKESLRRKAEEAERQEKAEKLRKQNAQWERENPVGALVVSVLLSGAAKGLKDYAASHKG